MYLKSEKCVHTINELRISTSSVVCKCCSVVTQKNGFQVGNKYNRITFVTLTLRGDRRLFLPTS